MSAILILLSFYRRLLENASIKSPRFLKNIIKHHINGIEYAEQFLSKIIHDEIFQRAGALAFVSMIAIVPTISLIFAIFSGFKFFGQAREVILAFVFKHFIPSSGEQIQSYFDNFIRNTAALSIFGIIALFIASVSLLASLDSSINRIWNVHKDRPFLNKIIIFWALITLSPIFLATSFFLSTVIKNLPMYQYFLRWSFFSSNTALLISYTMTFLTFFLILVVIPYTHVPKRFAAAGAVMGVVLWQVIKVWFSWYFTNFASFNKIYGQISVVPLFFIWVYMIWVIVLLCAEVTHLLTVGIKGLRLSRSKQVEIYALLMLRNLHRNFKKGKGGLSGLQMARQMKISVSNCEFIAEVLKKNNIIVESGKRFMLNRPLEKIFLYEIIQLFRPFTVKGTSVINDPFVEKITDYYKKIDNAVHTISRNVSIEQLINKQ